MKLYRYLIPLLAFPATVLAQPCSGVIPSGYFCGNSGASNGFAAPASPTTMLNRALGSTPNAILNNNSSGVPAFTVTPILGFPGASTGTLRFGGATSGTVTITPQAAAGTYNFNLPTGPGTSGQLLASGGGGSTAMSFVDAASAIVAAGTNISITGTTPATINVTAPFSATTLTNHGVLLGRGTSNIAALAVAAAGTVLAGVAVSDPAFTATPVLGIPTSVLGTLGLAGNTSGTATIRPQAVAGTPTLTLPNASGTFAVSASTPIVLSATTGNITCPTCAAVNAALAIPAEGLQ